MIQGVTTPEQRAEFTRRLAEKPYFAAVLGTRCALFAPHPASGWGFYLLPGTAVLAVRGGTAVLCGTLPVGEIEQEAREELQGFLQFLGVDRLLGEDAVLSGWHVDEPLLLWELPQGQALPLPAAPPADLKLDTHPAMLPVSRLVFPDSQAEQEQFYSMACTALAHGIGACWTLRSGEQPVCTVGCYEQSAGEAYLSAGVTEPAWQGRGLAGWLIVRLANAMARTRTVRFTCIPALRPFYTRLGFTPCGTIQQFLQE